ncbi:TPA: TATA-box-binding protein [Candidatus Micrarchaeota archaeon]|nr:TATA-box-binding protein [Candidatus Micrarchaeota archaeon]
MNWLIYKRLPWVIFLPKKPDFVITNMVASASLGLELDLFSLAQKIKEIEYEPEQFPGAILKFKEPKASLLLFKNGKVVCVGCKKRSLIEKTIDKTIKLLKPYAKKITRTKKPKIEITNIVASANLGIEVDLYRLAYKVKDVEYEPEQFPGAILKFKEPKASLLLFKNGKVICAGAKNENEIRAVLRKAKKLLKMYTEKKVKRR